MKIFYGQRPPNFEAIRQVFPMAAGKNVIFAYAPDIYVASYNPLPDSLIKHEEVHIARQAAMGVEAWWSRYLADVPFRYEEELLAHRAEYWSLVNDAPSRQVRRSALKIVASRLTSPLYGRLRTMQQAMEDILG